VTQFGFMSNYFAKLPAAFVQLLFGDDGLAESELPALPPPSDELSDPSTATVALGASNRSFLQPFRRKADTDHVRDVQGGRRIVGRPHERLVNECADWLRSRNLEPARNAAVDLGLECPAVVIEAKVVGQSWAPSIRAAVGQLYEYRFFKVSDPRSALVFLSDKPVPVHWVRYLERDRKIGVMWRTSPTTFSVSRLARRALRISR
jgi:hypothetical protein